MNAWELCAHRQGFWASPKAFLMKERFGSAQLTNALCGLGQILLEGTFLTFLNGIFRTCAKLASVMPRSFYAYNRGRRVTGGLQ